MANQEHLKRIKQGSAKWNAWKFDNKDIQIDMSRANLRGADLTGADRGFDLEGVDLSYAFLSRADLSYANLKGADLRRTDLSHANLRGTDLSHADLSYADLKGANLFVADLIETHLTGADLMGADLTAARLNGTTIAKVDLRATEGLATIEHSGPSHIELFSIQLPQDGSALHFLRNVGVPDEWINDYLAHIIQPIQYHSCFISYSSEDTILAQRLHADLQAQGVRCWFAPEDMKIGDRIRQRIDEAIHLQDKSLLLLSAQSIASSWVEKEVEAAFEKEDRQSREVLFPIRLDDTIMQTTQSWAATLRRTRHIGDFTQWKEPKIYRVAFARLLRDLKQN